MALVIASSRFRSQCGRTLCRSVVQGELHR